ncbi:MAG TPA: hypothetical protein VEZ20_12305 [Allosphingosinicella sp.]|jgi:hypothetical protein|nr:hypothetical protein [Allosphingosinicella sp.]
MIASLFAILLASAQPVPAEEPVVTEAEAQADVEADAGVEVEVPVGAQAPVAAEAQVTATAEAEAAADEPEEETVCRRRVIPAERVGQRHRTVRDCRPASEWTTLRRRGGA